MAAGLKERVGSIQANREDEAELGDVVIARPGSVTRVQEVLSARKKCMRFQSKEKMLNVSVVRSVLYLSIALVLY